MLLAKILSKAIFFAGGKMKKLKVLVAFLASATMFFASCASDSGGNDSVKPEVEPGTVGELPKQLLDSSELVKRLDSDNEKIILFYYQDNVNAAEKAVYNWITKGDESKNVPFETDPETGISYANFSEATLTDEVKEAISNKKDFNFIIKSSKIDDWGGQTSDLIFPLSEGIYHVMYYNGDLYTVSDNMSASISSARMETLTTIKVELGVKYGLQTFPDSNGFTVIANDNSSLQISDIVNYNSKGDRSKNNTNILLVTLKYPIDTSKIWTIQHNAFGSKTISTQNAVKISLNEYKYEGDDLGLTLDDGQKATFKVWAPIASDVKILFYDDVSKVGNFKPETVALNVSGSTTEESLKGEPSGSEQMILDKDSGIWSYTLDSVGNKKYYKYQITNNGTVYYVADIYAKSCSPDSIASQIVDINADGNYGKESNYVNPFKTNGTDYTDAVIYEMHIRDWSRSVNSASTGKFNEMCSDEIIAHLKDLGITHVQILPMFDYAQVNSDSGYNWGYNPYHYNVPEGRYTDYSANSDGTAAVEQMRAMIKKFHDAGIAVIMDVVYNHTSGTAGGSLYDSTVPYYYYRLTTDGSGGYSNGSGCGNETDSETPMFRKYMIDSLKHWMLDYHINGFRFDLMGIHSKEAMTEIYRELSSIDKNVMVYGEPWIGSDKAAVKDGAITSIEIGSYGVGAFDDDFRDAIKGAEYGGFNAGQVQGELNDDGIANGLIGKSGKNNRNTTGKPGLALHYAECHDNFTLYDKLVYSLKENIEETKKEENTDKGGEGIATAWPKTVTAEQLELIKKEDKLAAAYVLLSQGTPFINGGQEFLRTKKGNPDSYSADTKGGIKWTNEPGEHNIDDVNTIDLSMKERNLDVYNVYKGLIALRKSNLDAFGKNDSATAGKAKCLLAGTDKYARTAGVTKYTAGDFLVFFNATEKDAVLEPKEIAGYSKVVDITSGAPKESGEIVSSVPAKSFVILKK